LRVTLTVLGSGGPVANRKRVSSGYLISLDGVARMMIDAGGGIFERLGRAAIDLGGLEAILLTHTHIDHTGELPAVISHLYAAGRERPMAFAGPSANERNPGSRRFIDLLFGADGAWSYMNAFQGFGYTVDEASSSLSSLVPELVPLRSQTLPELGVSVRSVAIPHDAMPSVAYRIDIGERSITFSGDVAEAAPSLVALARDTDVLVHDLALPEGDAMHVKLHAKPSSVGQAAQNAAVRSLLVSHFTPEIEAEMEDALAVVRRHYGGPLFAAEDLATYEVGMSGVQPSVA